MAIRCRTPGMRNVASCSGGVASIALSTRPSRKRIAARRSTWPRTRRECPRRRSSAYGTAAPIANSRNGKTRSVGVQPFHAAWSSGAYTAAQVPGVLTRIIPAIVRPRNTSRDSKRAGASLMRSCSNYEFGIWNLEFVSETQHDDCVSGAKRATPFQIPNSKFQIPNCRNSVVADVAAEGERDAGRGRPGEHFVAAREAVEEPVHHVHLRRVLAQRGPLGPRFRRGQREAQPARDAAAQAGRRREPRFLLLERPR